MPDDFSDDLLQRAMFGDSEARVAMIARREPELAALVRQEIKDIEESQLQWALEKMRVEALNAFDSFVLKGLAYFQITLRRMVFFHLARERPVALGQLLHDFRPDMERLALKKQFHHAVSTRGGETVASDAIISAYKGFKDFRADNLQAFWSWLKTITIRQGMKNGPGGDSGSSQHDPADPRSGPGTHFEKREQRERMEESVAAALRKMPDEDRELLIFRHWKGMSHAEIAEVLGISEQAARVRYHRAKERIHAILASGDHHT